MKKLRLELDALRVESFDTAAAGAERRGTVHGNAQDVFAEAFGPASNEATCLTCRVPTDPCICDPIPTDLTS
ncbi:MAG TPA: hypothetical protein VF746_00795 [Longimicrobium sp.]|jgi:hypothetical protein